MQNLISHLPNIYLRCPQKWSLIAAYTYIIFWYYVSFILINAIHSRNTTRPLLLLLPHDDISFCHFRHQSYTHSLSWQVILNQTNTNGSRMCRKIRFRWFLLWLKTLCMKIITNPISNYISYQHKMFIHFPEKQLLQNRWVSFVC